MEVKFSCSKTVFLAKPAAVLFGTLMILIDNLNNETYMDCANTFFVFVNHQIVCCFIKSPVVGARSEC